MTQGVQRPPHVRAEITTAAARGEVSGFARRTPVA